MFKQLASFIVIILLAVASYFVWTNQQEIRDYVEVSQATIDPAVTQLVVDSGMNDRGVFLYHAASPRLETSEGFNRSCTRQEERSAILGCYVNDTIHIYDIKDERLSGVREVTASHEALHAIFARMSVSERDAIAPLLEAEYARIITNETELTNRMEYYERTQPGQRINELHSIVGTEYLGLSPELEEYYSQYFDDRSKVVNLHQQYKDRFDDLRGEASRLEGELNQLADDINDLSAQYDGLVTRLNQRVDNFNARANAGDFTDQASFNAERNALIQESNEIDSFRGTINQYIASYEQKRTEYNEIVTESNSMYESLDSTLEPSPQI